MYSEQELIKQWLEKYPSDKDCPDLRQKALAGYTRCADGLYRDGDHYWGWLRRYGGEG